MKRNVRIGFDGRGNPQYVTVHADTQDDLNDEIVRTYIHYGRIHEFRQNGSSLTFGEYARDWAQGKAHQVKPTTMAGYHTILNSHLLPVFDQMIFADITTSDFQAFLNDRKTLSKKYLGEMIALFGQIARDAKEDGVVDRVITESRRLYIPSSTVTVRTAISKHEFLDIEAVLSQLTPREEVFMALLMFTGLRRGEVLGLKWEDIDYENNLIHVRRNVTYVSGTPRIGTPKSLAGARDVPIMNHLRRHLKDLPIVKNPDEFIIHGVTDPTRPIAQASFVRMWNRISERLQLQGVTPHVLRHTYLTLLAGTGADMKTLQSIAGHSNVQITMDKYVHKQTDNIRKAGETLEQALFSA